jgi:hypothetical protein
MRRTSSGPRTCATGIPVFKLTDEETTWLLDDLDAKLRKHEQKLEELRATRRERQARLWAAYKPGYLAAHAHCPRKACRVPALS